MLTKQQVAAGLYAVKAETPEEAKVIVEMFFQAFKNKEWFLSLWVDGLYIVPSTGKYVNSDSPDIRSKYTFITLQEISDIESGEGRESQDIPTAPPYEKCEQYGDAGSYVRLQGFRDTVTVSRGDDTIFIDEPEHQAYIEIQQVNEVIKVGHDISAEFAKAILGRMKPEDVATVIAAYSPPTAPIEDVRVDWDKIESVLMNVWSHDKTVGTALAYLKTIINKKP